MKYQVLLSLKSNEKVFMNVFCFIVTGALRVNTQIGVCKIQIRLTHLTHFSTVFLPIKKTGAFLCSRPLQRGTK